MNYGAVIFDLFGTLVDYFPEEYYQNSYEMTAQALSAPVDAFKVAWRACRNDRDTGIFGSLEDDIVQVCKTLKINPEPSQIKKAAKIRLDTYSRNLEPRKGAVETLTALRSNGCKVGMITVCASEVLQLWDESPLASLIDTAVFSCKEGLLKPDPRIYRLACERLGVDPAKCLYVGDGSYDELNGAKQTGMEPVLILMGYNGGQGYRSPDAKDWAGPVVSGLSDILPIVGI